MAVQVQFQSMPASPLLQAEAQRRAQWLEDACGLEVVSRVVVARRTTPVGLVGDYTVHLDVQVSGRELVAASHQHNQNAANAIRDAFEAVKRQLAEHLLRRRLSEAQALVEAKYCASGGA